MTNDVITPATRSAIPSERYTPLKPRKCVKTKPVSYTHLGSECVRETFSYPSKAGLGHFIHTYVTDGEPIPTFVGEPERIEIPDCIDCFTNEIWDNLDENNKISLYVRMTDLTTGEIEERLINKHTL